MPCYHDIIFGTRVKTDHEEKVWRQVLRQLEPTAACFRRDDLLMALMVLTTRLSVSESERVSVSLDAI